MLTYHLEEILIPQAQQELALNHWQSLDILFWTPASIGAFSKTTE